MAAVGLGLAGCAQTTVTDYTSALQIAAQTYGAVQNGRQARAAAKLSNAQTDLVRLQLDAARKAIDLNSSSEATGVTPARPIARARQPADLLRLAEPSLSPPQQERTVRPVAPLNPHLSRAVSGAGAP